MLGWFVEPERADATLNDWLITDEEIEVQPENRTWMKIFAYRPAKNTSLEMPS